MPRSTVIRDTFTDRVLVGPETSREILVNQNHRFTLLFFISGEGASTQERDLHHLKVIRGDVRLIDVEQFAAFKPAITFDTDIGLPVVPQTWNGSRKRGLLDSRLSLHSVEDLVQQTTKLRAIAATGLRDSQL